jgi:chromosome segregation ATPase
MLFFRIVLVTVLLTTTVSSYRLVDIQNDVDVYRTNLDDLAGDAEKDDDENSQITIEVNLSEEAEVLSVEEVEEITEQLEEEVDDFEINPEKEADKKVKETLKEIAAAKAQQNALEAVLNNYQTQIAEMSSLYSSMQNKIDQIESDNLKLKREVIKNQNKRQKVSNVKLITKEQEKNEGNDFWSWICRIGKRIVGNFLDFFGVKI